MGNCYGKGGSRRQRRELTKRNGNKPTREAIDDDVNIESVQATSGGAIHRKVSDDTDGLPLHDGTKGPTTPFNTPATQNGFLETENFDPNTLGQWLSDHVFVRLVTPQQTSLLRRARIHYVPPGDWSTCAYCNHPSGDRYGYFLCSSMSLQLLDTLMENGWWRTGEVLFKPCFPIVCCPGYALRMPIVKFILKKKHRRVIRRWANFLRHGDSRWGNRNTEEPMIETLSPSEMMGKEGGVNDHDVKSIESGLVKTAVASAGIEKVEVVEEEMEEDTLTTNEVGGGRSDNMVAGEVGLSCVSSQSHDQVDGKRQRKVVTRGRGADPNKPPCRKAKQIRDEKRQRKKLAAAGGGGTESSKSNEHHNRNQPSHPSLHDLFADHRLAAGGGGQGGFKHKLDIKLLGCNPRHPDLTRTLQTAYNLYSKFQKRVHPGKTCFKSASDFEWGFMNSPVRNPPDRLEGSYHMHYYLDDELVMISILDILPKYFVSIYFIYDPDIRFLTPGIYTVLVELDLVQQLHHQQTTTRPQYYALGYYNFNPKVSYKEQFKPQEILCNETNVFVPMVSALPKLSQKSYTRLAGDELPEKAGRTASLDNLMIDTRISGLQPVPYQYLDIRIKNLCSSALRDLISETGEEAAHQMVIAVHV